MKLLIFNILNLITVFTLFSFIILIIYNGLYLYSKKSKYFLFLLIDCFLFSLFFTIENLIFDLNLAIIFAKLTYFALSFFPVLFLLLVFQVITHNKIIQHPLFLKITDSWAQIFLYIPSLFIIIMVLLNKYNLTVIKLGEGFYIKILCCSNLFIIFNYLYEITSIAFLFYAIKKNKEKNLRNKELIFLFIGFIIPLIYMIVIAILQLFGVEIYYPFELWFLLITGLFLFIGISRYGIILGNVFNKKIFTSSNLIISGVNLSNEIFEVNDSFLKLFHLERKEVIGKNLSELSKKSEILFEGFSQIFDYIQSFIANEKTAYNESESIFEVKDKINNTERYFELNINPVIIKKELFGHIFVLNDITLRKTTEDLLLKKQRLLEAVVKSLDELITNSNLDLAINNTLKKIGIETQVDRVYIFENFEDKFKNKIYSSQKFEWVNNGIKAQLNNPELKNIELAKFYPEMFLELSNNRQFFALIKNLPQPLKMHFEKQDIISILVVPIFVNNNFWGFIGLDDCEKERSWSYDEILTLKAAAEVIGDAIMHRRMSDTIKQLAYYDAITGLPNRVLFYERLKLSIELAKRNNKLLAVALMDFDKFKDINDTYGHDIGDDLLKAFSERIVNIIRKTDTIARFGGDEFVLLVTNINSGDNINKILEKVLNCFKEPFVIKNYTLKINSSIGIAIYPENGIEIVDLIKNADIAMYQAKKLKTGSYCYFSNIMEA